MSKLSSLMEAAKQNKKKTAIIAVVVADDAANYKKGARLTPQVV